MGRQSSSRIKMGKKDGEEDGEITVFCGIIPSEVMMIDDNDDLITKEYDLLLAGKWSGHSDPRLIYTTDLSEFKMPKYRAAKAVLTSFYNSPDPTHKRAASVLNSVFTQGVSIFLMTKKILEALIRGDSNIALKSLDGTSYKLLKKFFLEKGILEEVIKPSAYDSKGPKRAGSYKLVDEKLLDYLDQLVGSTIRLAREKAYMKWQLETDKVAEITLSAEQIAYDQQMSARAEEKRKKYDPQS